LRVAKKPIVLDLCVCRRHCDSLLFLLVLLLLIDLFGLR
jgi:hypothetical protein